MPTHDQLVPRLYDQLHLRARRLLAQHRGGSVSPSSLVHEMLLKVYAANPSEWNDEVHFRATAAMAMRQILLDRHRARQTQKRGGDLQRVTLSGLAAFDDPVDAMAIRRALLDLEEAQPRTAEVVVLRLLGGLEIEEVARYLSISGTTVKREWRRGHAWLRTRLAG